MRFSNGRKKINKLTRIFFFSCFCERRHLPMPTMSKCQKLSQLIGRPINRADAIISYTIVSVRNIDCNIFSPPSTRWQKNNDNVTGFEKLVKLIWFFYSRSWDIYSITFKKKTTGLLKNAAISIIAVDFIEKCQIFYFAFCVICLCLCKVFIYLFIYVLFVKLKSLIMEQVKLLSGQSLRLTSHKSNFF